MFARTLGSVAVGLGELRQPTSSPQYLRAASTAGALLAGYFPHLRGAFHFPPHLAHSQTERSLGDVQCAAGHQYPQIASLLSTAQEPSAVEANRAKEPPLQVKGIYDDADPDTVRTSVVATLLAKEYGPRMHRLEQKCVSLYASNQQLQADTDAAQAQSEKSRELNRRLCREINEVRLERTAAHEELDRVQQKLELAKREQEVNKQLCREVNEARSERSAAVKDAERFKHKMERAREELDKARNENTSLREALEASQKQVFELTKLYSEPAGELSPQNFPQTASLHLQGQGPSPESLMVSFGSGTCSCTSSLSWGCAMHRVYSDTLLLAHRDVASKIAKGPPGLELLPPPGLESSSAL